MQSVKVLSEDSDTLLSEMSWMVLEDVSSLMGETSGFTSTGWMLPVLSDSSVSVRNVSSQFSAFPLSGGLVTGRLPF